MIGRRCNGAASSRFKATMDGRMITGIASEATMIQLSPSAVTEILRLQKRRQQENLRLRLGIQPSECLQFSYTLQFDPQLAPDDRVFHCDVISVVVDASSLAYLDGLSLDYSEDLMGGSFRFDNPNACQSCDCGASFAVSDAGTV